MDADLHQPIRRTSRPRRGRGRADLKIKRMRSKIVINVVTTPDFRVRLSLALALIKIAAKIFPADVIVDVRRSKDK